MRNCIAAMFRECRGPGLVSQYCSLLYASTHECFTGKYTTHKIHTELHPVL